MPHDEIISNDVLDAALRLQEFCRARDWRCCFIGGLAVQKWGEPRVTDDVDLTLFTGLGTETPFIDALLARDWVEPRIPGAREFAQTRRVLLLQTKGRVGIDVAMGAFPFEEEAVRRGQEITLLPGRALRLCARVMTRSTSATSTSNCAPCSNSRRHRNSSSNWNPSASASAVRIAQGHDIPGPVPARKPRGRRSIPPSARAEGCRSRVAVAMKASWPRGRARRRRGHHHLGGRAEADLHSGWGAVAGQTASSSTRPFDSERHACEGPASPWATSWATRSPRPLAKAGIECGSERQ